LVTVQIYRCITTRLAGNAHSLGRGRWQTLAIVVSETPERSL